MVTPIEVTQELQSGDRVSPEQLLSVGDAIRNYSPEQKQEVTTAIRELERVRNFRGAEHPETLEKITQLNDVSRPRAMNGETLSPRNNVVVPAQAELLPMDTPLEVATPLGDLDLEREVIPPAESDGSRFQISSERELFVSSIESATDMRSLMRRLAERGNITAPDGYVYKKEDILNTVGLLKDSRDPNLQRVTNTYGLRDKVRKLLLQREAQ